MKQEDGSWHYDVPRIAGNYDGDTIKAYLDVGVSIRLPGLADMIDLGMGLFIVDGKVCSRQNVRLADVDTPEIRGGSDNTKELARKARDKVSEWFDHRLGSGVVFKSIERGKYGRLVGDFFVPGSQMPSLSQYLINERLGVPYGGGDRSAVLEQHEANARFHFAAAARNQ